MNMKQTRLRVNRIESYRDISGNLGKKIELVEDQQLPGGFQAVQTEEGRVISEVMMQVQRQFGAMPLREWSNPKLWLFLTEEEYEALGIILDVNQTYEVTFQDQAIKFTKAQEA
jgi:hypothetical protein